jgi:hypothetical protein
MCVEVGRKGVKGVEFIEMTTSTLYIIVTCYKNVKLGVGVTMTILYDPKHTYPKKRHSHNTYYNITVIKRLNRVWTNGGTNVYMGDI